MLHRDLLLLFSIALFVVLQPAQASTGEEFYRDQVRPLLLEKCAACHGAIKQESGLRLDHGGLLRQGADSGAVLDVDAPETSELLTRVTTQDVSLQMPPEGEGARLTEEQVDVLRTWIEAGAVSPDSEPVPAGPDEHWAFQPLHRPALPPGSAATERNPVDAFVRAELSRQALTPLPPADKSTLLRRVMLDLVGLPPTRAEQEAFLGDPSPSAWSDLVEELLQRPSHGQRWARHWMDVWRYSDWDGYKNELRSSQRHIWHWREWIIESLNADKGYDEMIVEMLAGDELAPTDDQVLRATGFLARNYHKSNRNIWLDATVEHTAKAFLGLTLDCARCHDHKYDPLPQRDYYAFRAVFEPHRVRTERLPGESDVAKAGLPRVYDADLDAATYLYIAGNEKHPDKEHPLAPGVPELFGIPFEVQAIDLPPEAVFPALRPHQEAEDVAEAKQRVQAARQALVSQASSTEDLAFRIAAQALLEAEVGLASLRARWAADKARFAEAEGKAADVAALQTAAIAAEFRHRSELAQLKLLQAQQKLALAKAESDEHKKAQTGVEQAQKAAKTASEALHGALASLTNSALPAGGVETGDSPQEWNYTSVGKVYPRQSTGRRLALANWITHRENPLTARVAVNYVWLHHFGQPLVDNVFDFGMRSPEPVYRELLDWLAVELIEHDWSLKHLHRLIVNSETYRTSSASLAAPAVWQVNQRTDPDNRLLWRANVRRLDAEVIRDSVLHVAGNLDLSAGGPDIDFALGETNYRRSVYFRHAYEKQMPMLVLFDAAAPTECYRRSPSIIPQQALALANSPLSFDQSRQLAAVLAEQLPKQPTEEPAGESFERGFVAAAFRRVLGRACTADEQQACVQFLSDQRQVLSQEELLRPLGGAAQAQTEPAASAEQRARENLVHALLNHNDFVTVR